MINLHLQITAMERLLQHVGHLAEAPAPVASRRAVLMAAISVGLSSAFGPALAQQSIEDTSLASLPALLDILLPEDDVTPSATALGVDREKTGFIAENDRMVQLFAAALGWIDQLADRPFRDLTLAQQVEVVSFLEGADYNQVPGRFYHILRALAVEFYFARIEALAGLPLNSAPQPLGYLPPWG